MKIKVISTTDKNRCNCVMWLRVERGKKFPYGQYTIQDKIKIINTKIPQVGAIAILNIGVNYWHKGKYVNSGHLAEVISFTRKSNGEYYLVIREANRVRCRITETKGTEKELKVLGYLAYGSTPAPAPEPKLKPTNLNINNSIVDYLKYKNMPSGFLARRRLYRRAFYTWRYWGNAKQNTRLLEWAKRKF